MIWPGLGEQQVRAPRPAFGRIDTSTSTSTTSTNTTRLTPLPLLPSRHNLPTPFSNPKPRTTRLAPIAPALAGETLNSSCPPIPPPKDWKWQARLQPVRRTDFAGVHGRAGPAGQTSSRRCVLGSSSNNAYPSSSSTSSMSSMNIKLEPVRRSGQSLPPPDTRWGIPITQVPMSDEPMGHGYGYAMGKGVAPYDSLRHNAALGRSLEYGDTVGLQEGVLIAKDSRKEGQERREELGKGMKI
ncbi:hypothetical protein CPC08DRAFT_730962 [Agrocybe pediades]|nr:hypothetical protein CPC08DRAFT_730962 [Agrocybe pediades]